MALPIIQELLIHHKKRGDTHHDFLAQAGIAKPLKANMPIG